MCIAYPFRGILTAVVALMLPLFLGAITPYEVVMVRGEVTYKGTLLRKGSLVEAPDLRNQDLLKEEMAHFSFGGTTDEVHLLDTGLRKVVVVSARLRQPGRDLMLATRSLGTLRSDFEFRRAFTPDTGLILMVREDTLLCQGLTQFAFGGHRRLAIRYHAGGQEITRVVGENDTLYLTREKWFGTTPGTIPLNSFEISGIQLYIDDQETGSEETLHGKIPPFSLVFLDDIIRYRSEISYPGVQPDPEEIYGFLFPALVKERQIQRSMGLYTPEEALTWLRQRIARVLSETSQR